MSVSTFDYSFKVLVVACVLPHMRSTEVSVIWLQIISWAAKSGIPVILWYIYI